MLSFCRKTTVKLVAHFLKHATCQTIHEYDGEESGKSEEQCVRNLTFLLLFHACPKYSGLFLSATDIIHSMMTNNAIMGYQLKKSLVFFTPSSWYVPTYVLLDASTLSKCVSTT